MWTDRQILIYYYKIDINPFHHTTILQQTTLNIFCQNIENLHNWMDNLWLKVENIVAKGEIARFVQFLLLSLCFQKSRPLQWRQKASIWGKGLIINLSMFYLDDFSSRFARIQISWQESLWSKSAIHTLFDFYPEGWRQFQLKLVYRVNKKSVVRLIKNMQSLFLSF